MRLCWCREVTRARLRCNPPVFDLEGRHLLTPDLLDVDHGVSGEYDGAVHLGDVDTSTVTARRALDASERAIWLSWRRRT